MTRKAGIGVMVATLAATVATAAPARAQCPDGSPRPCAARRAATPPLDDSRWVVVPFRVLSPSPDLEWLRDGSVSLLSSDMAQWKDVRVVDDRRVADYLREIPNARAGQALSLNDGMEVAKRSGAGRLVMGELLKIGGTIRVTATVFDARRSVTLRRVQDQVPAADSLLGLYGRLARRLLNLPASSGPSPSSGGATRVDAYQEYLAGVRALHQFSIGEARQRFEKALQLDSTFALAHYKIVIGSIYDEADELRRVQNTANTLAAIQAINAEVEAFRLQHAASAQRLSAGLPPRERGLIAGQLAYLKGDYEKACASYSALVAADSSDVDALYGLGQCMRGDNAIVADGGDTTRVRFRSSWNTAMRLYRRAVLVDPAFHLAFSPIVTMLTSTRRAGCRPPPGEPCPTPPAVRPGERPDTARLNAYRRIPRYTATMRRAADSLVLVPVLDAPRTAFTVQTAERSTARRQGLETALNAAREWVESGPDESRAHRAYGRFLLALGRYDEAEAQFTIAYADKSFKDIELIAMRAEVALKSWRVADAQRWMDTLAAAVGPGVGASYPKQLGVFLGRVADMERGQAQLARSVMGADTSGLAVVVRSPQVVRALLGVSPDTVLAIEDLMVPAASRTTTCTVCQVPLFAAFWTLALGPRIPRTSWPKLADPVSDLRLGPASALSRGDTAALRRSARQLDSSVAVAVSLYEPEDGSSVAAAEAWLALGDSAAALKSVSTSLDQLMVMTPLRQFMGASLSAAALWPRAMLLRADLLAASEKTDEARIWYKRFADLWATADPEFQPIVARARAASR